MDTFNLILLFEVIFFTEHEGVVVARSYIED